MSEKKGFFSFFKGKSKGVTVFSEEEEKQRSYAIAKEQEERQEQVQLEKQARMAPKVAPIFDTPPSEMALFGKDKLEELLDLTQFGGQVHLTHHEPDRLSYEIVHSDDAGRIIGKDGSTLEAFQTLLRGFIYKKFSTPVRVTLDIGDYRKKKEEILKAHATKAAKAVLQDGGSFDLKPMSAEERRMVHTMFQDDSRIKSYSVGEGQNRHIVLEEKDHANA